MELHEAVVCLANWRAEVKRLEAAQKAMVKAVMESPEYKRLGEEYVHAHQMEGETEWTVRGLAEDQFRSTGVKAVHDAIVVKVYTELRYDPGEALDYCRTQMPGALKLDARKFEAAAKALGLRFVETIETPKATIATDLSAYL